LRISGFSLVWVLLVLFLYVAHISCQSVAFSVTRTIAGRNRAIAIVPCAPTQVSNAASEDAGSARCQQLFYSAGLTFLCLPAGFLRGSIQSWDRVARLIIRVLCRTAAHPTTCSLNTDSPARISHRRHPSPKPQPPPRPPGVPRTHNIMGPGVCRSYRCLVLCLISNFLFLSRWFVLMGFSEQA